MTSKQHIKKGVTTKKPIINELVDPCDFDQELFEDEKEFLKQLKTKENNDHFSKRFMMICAFCNQLDIEKTQKFLDKNWNWRYSHGFATLPDFKGLNYELITSGTLFAVPGTRSKTGCSLAYMSPGKFFPANHSQENLLELMIWIWHRGFDAERMDTFRNGGIVVQDMSELGWKNIDMKMIKALMEIAQQYFPQRVKKILMIDPPAIIRILLRIASVFVDKKILKAIQVVTRAQLLEFVDADQLPISFGGKLNFEPGDYLQHLIDREEKFGTKKSMGDVD